MYCSTGCCGSSINRYCCAETAVGVGAVVGGAVGSILFVAFVVIIFVAVGCCCRKTEGRSGQVVQPVTTPATTVNERQTCDENTQQGSCQPGNGQPVYSQPGYGQPGYGQGGYTNQGYSWHTSNMQSGAKQNWGTPPPPYDQNFEKPPPPYEQPPPYESPLTASPSHLRGNALVT